MATARAVAAPQTSALLAVGDVLRRVFSFPVLLGGMLVGGGYVFSRFTLSDPDTWWHLKVGEQILRSGTWPVTDPYSFTVSGTHWMAYEWLGEVIMAGVARLGGLRALAALLVGLVSVLLVLLYWYASLRCGNPKAAFVACALVLSAAAAFFTLRPQLLGYIFLLITLICLEYFRRGRAWVLWLLPPLFLVWVNTHGTFAFGLLALGLYWASGQVKFHKGGLAAERWAPRQSLWLAVVMLLCVLVLPLTPYGSRIAAYPLEISLSQPVNVASIQEWQPLAFSGLLGKVFLGLLVLFFLAHVVLEAQFRVEEIALLLFGAFAACVHLRFVPVFLAAFTPLVAVLLARWLPSYEPSKDRPFLNAAFLAGIALAVAFSFPSSRRLQEVTSEQYPQAAVEYLRSHRVPGPMLNEYGWGGYLIWAVGPERKVFIDGRADIYEYAGVLSDYMSITWLKPDALALLRKYGVESCLVGRKAPLATLLAALPEWQRVYADDLTTVYVRRPGSAGASHNSVSDRAGFASAGTFARSSARSSPAAPQP